MRILFDQGTPWGLRRILTGHTVRRSYQLGWQHLSNGQLLDSAEAAGYELLITTDTRMPYQQNLSGRQLAIIGLAGHNWPYSQRTIDAILTAVNEIKPGEFRAVLIPQRAGG